MREVSDTGSSSLPCNRYKRVNGSSSEEDVQKHFIVNEKNDTHKNPGMRQLISHLGCISGKDGIVPSPSGLGNHSTIHEQMPWSDPQV